MATKEKKAKAPAAKKVSRGVRTGAATGSVVQSKYLDGRYKKSDVKTASGKRFAQDIGDEVAEQLRGLDMAGMRTLARQHGLQDRFDEKWGKLNPGLCRMSMGNALRGLAKGPKEKPAGRKTPSKAKAA